MGRARDFALNRARINGKRPPKPIAQLPEVNQPRNLDDDPLPIDPTDVDNTVWWAFQKRLLGALRCYGIIGLQHEMKKIAAEKCQPGSEKSQWTTIHNDQGGNASHTDRGKLQLFLCQHNTEFWEALMRGKIALERTENPQMAAYLETLAPDSGAGGYINIVADWQTGKFLTPNDLYHVRECFVYYAEPEDDQDEQDKRNEYARKVEEIFYGDLEEQFTDPDSRRWAGNKTAADAVLEFSRSLKHIFAVRIPQIDRDNLLSYCPAECGWSVHVDKRIKDQEKGLSAANRNLSIMRAVLEVEEYESEMLSFTVTRVWERVKHTCDMAEVIPTIMTNSMSTYNTTKPGTRGSFDKLAADADKYFAFSADKVFRNVATIDNAVREVHKVHRFGQNVRTLTDNDAYINLPNLKRDVARLEREIDHRKSDLLDAEDACEDVLDDVLALDPDYQNWLASQINSQWTTIKQQLTQFATDARQIPRQNHTVQSSIPANLTHRIISKVWDGEQDTSDDGEGSTLGTQLVLSGVSPFMMRLPPRPSFESRLKPQKRTFMAIYDFNTDMQHQINIAEKVAHDAMDCVGLGNLAKKFDVQPPYSLQDASEDLDKMLANVQLVEKELHALVLSGSKEYIEEDEEMRDGEDDG